MRYVIVDDTIESMDPKTVLSKTPYRNGTLYVVYKNAIQRAVGSVGLGARLRGLTAEIVEGLRHKLASQVAMPKINPTDVIAPRMRPNK